MRVDFSKTANEELKDYKKHLLELKKKGELPSYVKIPESLKKHIISLIFKRFSLKKLYMSKIFINFRVLND